MDKQQKRIQSERERISAALVSGRISDKEYCELYAAQQALIWAENPETAKSPYETVLLGRIQPLLPANALSLQLRENLQENVSTQPN